MFSFCKPSGLSTHITHMYAAFAFLPQVFGVNLTLAAQRGTKRAMLAAWRRRAAYSAYKAEMRTAASLHRDSRAALGALRAWCHTAARCAYTRGAAAVASANRDAARGREWLAHWRWYCCNRRLLLRVFEASYLAWEALWDSGTMMYGAEYRLLLRTLLTWREFAADSREDRRLEGLSLAAEAHWAGAMQRRVFRAFDWAMDWSRNARANAFIRRRGVLKWRDYVRRKKDSGPAFTALRRGLRRRVRSHAYAFRLDALAA